MNAQRTEIAEGAVHLITETRINGDHTEKTTERERNAKRGAGDERARKMQTT
jgi:hypothetical protein